MQSSCKKKKKKRTQFSSSTAGRGALPPWGQASDVGHPTGSVLHSGRWPTALPVLLSPRVHTPGTRNLVLGERRGDVSSDFQGSKTLSPQDLECPGTLGKSTFNY